MKVIDVVKIGFSTALFGGAVLWAYADGGWEPYLAAISAFAAILYFVHEIKSSPGTESSPLVHSSNKIYDNNGTILSGFVNNGQLVVNEKPDIKTAPSKEYIQNTIQQLRSSFLMTTNVVELRRISHQILEIKAHSADALMLYEMVDKAIKFHESRGFVNLVAIVTLLTTIAMCVIALIRQLLQGLL